MPEKRQPLQQMVLGKLNVHMYTTENRPLSFTPVQMDQNINVRLETSSFKDNIGKRVKDR
jgi:hypothetical protein